MVSMQHLLGSPSEMPHEFRVIVENAVGTVPSTDRGRRTYSTVLSVAEHEFVRADYSQISVESIATRAEVSVGSVYRYFGSTEGLYMVVHSRCLIVMHEAARSGADTGGSYRENLKKSTQEYLRAYHKYRFVMGAAEHLGSTSQRVRELNWALQRLIREGMSRGLGRMQSASALPNLPVEIQMRALTSMVDGYARRTFVDGEFGADAASAASIENAAEVLSLVWLRSVLGSELAN